LEVWDINTYERRGTLKGHQGSVLCLCLSEDKKLLFSSAGDAIVKVLILWVERADREVWDAVALKPLYIIYSTFDIGDVFAVVYAQSLKTIYLGAQNTSIQVLPPTNDTAIVE
jgi:di- and tripeptidase